MSPTVSFWDCGEFIATSYTLGVPHPPGSPLYLIIGRIFSMLPFNNDIAYRVNMISPIVSAVAVMLLYLIIVKFAAHWRGGINNNLMRSLLLVVHWLDLSPLHLRIVIGLMQLKQKSIP